MKCTFFRRSKSIECFCISDDLNRHRFMKNHNPISNIDNDAHVILLQIRCLTWSISQTVFVHFHMLSKEASLFYDIKYISNHESFVHIHFRVSLFLPWLFFKIWVLMPIYVLYALMFIVTCIPLPNNVLLGCKHLKGQCYWFCKKSIR